MLAKIKTRQPGARRSNSLRSGRPDQAESRMGSGGKSDQSKENRRIMAAVIFAVGVLVGMVILGASIYADFESMLFDVFLSNRSSPRLINCPILISTEEKGIVSATLRNSEDKPIERRVRVHISRGHLILVRELEYYLELDPGEEIYMEWEVTPKDAAYGHLIFAKVLFSQDDRNPLKRGSCGILVLDFPWGLKGSTVVFIMYLISFISIITSLVIWWRFGRSYTGIRLEATRAMIILGVMILLGLIFALFGLWEIAAGTFYLAILAIGVVVPHFIINLFRPRHKIS